MATRSNIGIMDADGTIRAIYCHNDGYPEHHLPILMQHYNTTEKVEALLALGSCSILRNNLGQQHRFDEDYEVAEANEWSRFYVRDRGETMHRNSAITFASVADLTENGAGEHYVFKDGQWWYEENGVLLPGGTVLSRY